MSIIFTLSITVCAILPRGRLCKSGLFAKICGTQLETEGVFLRIPPIIKIVTDSDTVNVLKSTLALLHYRECRIARCHTALKTLAVGR